MLIVKILCLSFYDLDRESDLKPSRGILPDMTSCISQISAALDIPFIRTVRALVVADFPRLLLALFILCVGSI